MTTLKASLVVKKRAHSSEAVADIVPSFPEADDSEATTHWWIYYLLLQHNVFSIDGEAQKRRKESCGIQNCSRIYSRRFRSIRIVDEADRHLWKVQVFHHVGTKFPEECYLKNQGRFPTRRKLLKALRKTVDAVIVGRCDGEIVHCSAGPGKVWMMQYDVSSATSLCKGTGTKLLECIDGDTTDKHGTRLAKFDSINIDVHNTGAQNIHAMKTQQKDTLTFYFDK